MICGSKKQRAKVGVGYNVHTIIFNTLRCSYQRLSSCSPWSLCFLFLHFYRSNSVHLSSLKISLSTNMQWHTFKPLVWQKGTAYTSPEKPLHILHSHVSDLYMPNSAKIFLSGLALHVPTVRERLRWQCPDGPTTTPIAHA